MKNCYKKLCTTIYIVFSFIVPLQAQYLPTDDLDSDAIINIIDIDDDNDGIPDALESPNCFYKESEALLINGVTSEMSGVSSIVYTWDNNTATTFSFFDDMDVDGLEIFNISLTAAIELASIEFNHSTVVSILEDDGTELAGAILQAFNGVTWVDLTGTLDEAAVMNPIMITMNQGSYLQYRLLGIDGHTNNLGGIAEILVVSANNYIASLNPKPSCIDDTDGDGLYNHQDLDSDGDGCSDLTEVNSGGLIGDLVTENPLYVGVGVNGLADHVEITPDSNLINYNSAIFFIDNTQNACTDSDNDGVYDPIDLDDDNDGIIDVNEGYCDPEIYAETIPTGQGTPWFIASPLQATKTVMYLGNPVTITVTLSNTTGMAPRFRINGIGHVGFTNSLRLSWGGPDVGRVTIDCSNPAMPINIYLIDFDDIWWLGYPQSLFPVSSEPTSIPSNWQQPGGAGNPIYAAMPSVANNGEEGEFNFIQSWPLIIDIGAYQFPWTYSNIGLDVLGVGLPSICNLDTDGDGIYNHLDLDSDGDGCSDSNEAYASATIDGGDSGIFGPDLPTLSNGGVNINGLVIAAGVNLAGDTYVNNPVTTSGGQYAFQEAVTVAVTESPVDVEVCGTTSTIFTAKASASQTPITSPVTTADTDIKYQWQVSTDGGMIFTDIIGESGTIASGTQVALSLTGITNAMSGNIYKVAFINEANVCQEEVQAILTVCDSTIDFDGINDYGNRNTLVRNLEECTMMAWVKADEIRGADIMGQYCYRMFTNDLGELQVQARTGTLKTTTASTATFLPVNTWTHVAAIYDGLDNTLKLYINGEEVALVATTGNDLDNDTNDFEIGRRSYWNNRYFKGAMQEVRVYNVALTVKQLREQIYQPIENNGGLVSGSIIPKNIDEGSLFWNNLIMYLKLNPDEVNAGITGDLSLSENDVIMNNVTTSQGLSAPIPYVANMSGSWTTVGTWEHGDVWDIENLPNKDWSIIHITNNAKVTTTNSHQHLGLLIDGGSELVIQDDNSLTNTSYLKLDGVIDLVGESQLIQTTDSDLDLTSGGALERDQQGKSDLYSYNHWSSPVSPINTTANNTDYSISGILRDGTDPNSPQPITFISSGYDGAAGIPISLADYWIFKYVNQPDDYGNWFSGHVRSTGSIGVGEGYTQKGPGSGGSSQNYVFIGKPNNGTIQHAIGANNSYLLGNPYPSALDANQFILDNITSTTGTLYFWEHWGGGSHLLAAYQGGYATYNLTGGVMAMSDPDVSSVGSGSIVPERYVPVGQGFFAQGSVSGGTVEFNNGQRVFEKESGGNSIFFNRSALPSLTNNEVLAGSITDDIQRAYFRFIAPEGAERQLLLGVKEGLSEGFNNGYDAKRLYSQITDCAWELDEDLLVIQTIDEITDNLELPLSIEIANGGLCGFEAESLSDLPEGTTAYFVDKQTQEWRVLEEGVSVEFNLPSGVYTNRFYIVFKVKPTEEEIAIEDTTEVIDNLVVYYDASVEGIKLVNIKDFTLSNIKLYTILGKETHRYNKQYINSNEVILPVNVATGTYLLEFIYNKERKILKKVIIK